MRTKNQLKQLRSEKRKQVRHWRTVASRTLNHEHKRLVRLLALQRKLLTVKP